MFSTSDTIVAIATPPGRGGLGVVRLSGAEAARVAQHLTGRDAPLTPRHATFARLGATKGSGAGSVDVDAVRDHVVVTFFPAPHSYTGEDVVEVSAHGSPIILQGILRAAVEAGARLAEPGEFTLRAFLHGKVDLIQAEAVADLIDAVTPLQARAAFDQLEGTLTLAIAAIESELFDLVATLEASLDFPEEGYHFIAPGEGGASVQRVRARIAALLAQASRGRLIREGAQVVIAGTPNVGKSSLFNALLSANRAIVTAIPGTTRDLISERASVHGVPVALVDTAGVRDTRDPIEREGVDRARGAMQVAEVLLVVLDCSRPLGEEDTRLLVETARRRRVTVVNKTDLPRAWGLGALPLDAGPVVEISVRSRAGLEELTREVSVVLGGGADERDAPAVTNLRHATLLERADAALARAEHALVSSNGRISEEFVLADLQEAASFLQEIVGRRSAEDLLRRIFERFCIGK